MRILQISTMSGSGSVGHIAVDLYNTIIKNDHECLICYGRGTAPTNVNTFRFNNKSDVYYHAVMTRLTDKTGFYSVTATRRLINGIEKFKPDIIHLHCLHGYYINIEILFNYLKKSEIPVIWTMHDCWPFTGHCAYFDYVKCDKWKTGCFNCPQIKSFPSSIKDNSEWNYEIKRELFTSLKNLTIVTPSKWLAKLVKQSFLKVHDVKVINNGIDLEKFRPTESSFRDKHKLKDKFVILGVASIWDRRKGLSDFIKLSKMLGTEYRIVVVGVTNDQKKKLPKNIIGIAKTNNVEELIKIYSASDVFLNTTYEDNFPTTNIESLACGTPIITYDTGGSAESINEKCGVKVARGNINELLCSIKDMRKQKKLSEDCTIRAKAFDRTLRYKEYLNLYEEVLLNEKDN